MGLNKKKYMLPVIKPYLNEPNRILPFPGDMNSIVDFLFKSFNTDAKQPDGHFSKKMIKEWLLDFLQINSSENKQDIINQKEEAISSALHWDYDDANDLYMK